MNRMAAFRSRGQSIVELALLLPILLVLAVVTIDFGRGIYSFSVVYNSAQEGARFGIINPDDYAGIDNAVRKLAIGLNPDQLFVRTYVNAITNTIQVSVCYNFSLVTPMSEVFVDENPCDGNQYAGAPMTCDSCIKLESASTMPLER